MNLKDKKKEGARKAIIIQTKHPTQTSKTPTNTYKVPYTGDINGGGLKRRGGTAGENLVELSQRRTGTTGRK